MSDPQKTSAYLDVKYSAEAIPYTEYPYKLGAWLRDNVYGRTGRLLDVGSGRGEHMRVFASLGFETAGIDVSPKAPELCRGLDVKVADLDHDPLPYPQGSFDFVYTKSVIEHVRNPDAMLARIFEALRPGGIAAIMTPSWEHQYYGPFYVDHTHVSPFTAPGLTNAMKMAGFPVARTEYFHQLPFLWKAPALTPLVRLFAQLPLRHRPFYPDAGWPDGFNKLIRFSKEVMLLGIGVKPGTARG